jgi:xanthine dehydrogenase molybdopterin-binding subunit B
VIAKRHGAELHGGVGDAAELDEVEMNGLKHAANLAVLALADADDEPGMIAGVAIADDVCGKRDISVVEHDALAESLDAGVHVVDDATEFCLVDLGNFVARMGE